MSYPRNYYNSLDLSWHHQNNFTPYNTSAKHYITFFCKLSWLTNSMKNKHINKTRIHPMKLYNHHLKLIMSNISLCDVYLWEVIWLLAWLKTMFVIFYIFPLFLFSTRFFKYFLAGESFFQAYYSLNFLKFLFVTF